MFHTTEIHGGIKAMSKKKITKKQTRVQKCTKCRKVGHNKRRCGK